MAYNKHQWRESFEGQFSLLRPHPSSRLLEMMSLSAWTARGSKDEDPVKATKEESTALDSRRRT